MDNKTVIFTCSGEFETIYLYKASSFKRNRGTLPGYWGDLPVSLSRFPSPLPQQATVEETFLLMPTRVTATTKGGYQVLTQALTFTCLPWYNQSGNNTPAPQSALGLKGQTGPICTNELTSESSLALRMETPRVL